MHNCVHFFSTRQESLLRTTEHSSSALLLTTPAKMLTPRDHTQLCATAGPSPVLFSLSEATTWMRQKWRLMKKNWKNDLSYPNDFVELISHVLELKCWYHVLYHRILYKTVSVHHLLRKLRVYSFLWFFTSEMFEDKRYSLLSKKTIKNSFLPWNSSIRYHFFRDILISIEYIDAYRHRQIAFIMEYSSLKMSWTHVLMTCTMQHDEEWRDIRFSVCVNEHILRYDLIR